MIPITPHKSSFPCSQCGSRLILVKRTATKDNFSKVTLTYYRCSNKECQAGIDKKTAARIKLQNDQNLARETHLKARLKLNKAKKLKN